jgi:monoterpene epsilon-lactone hydrolase
VVSVRTSMFERMVVLLGVKRRLRQVVDASNDPDLLAAVVEKQRKWDQPKPPSSIARAWDVDPSDIGGFPLHIAVHPSGSRGRVILYLHGGGYMFGPFRPEWTMVAKLASATDCDFALLGYPKAPEHGAAETVGIARQAHSDLISRYGASNVILVGSSAGGGLAVVIMAALRDAGQPQPPCAVLMSPAVDMTLTVDASGIEDDDLLLSVDFVRTAGEAYAQPLRPDDPLVSPIFGNLGGLAPLLVLAGSREILLPSIESFVSAAGQAGTNTELVIGNGQQHAWPHAPTPEGGEAIQRIASFIASSADSTT